MSRLDLPSNPKLPEELWSIRAVAIDSAYSGNSMPDALDRLTDWLEGDGYDSLLSFYNDEFVLNLYCLTLCDSDLRDHLGLNDAYIISDPMRAEFTRKWLIEQSQELDDGLLFPSLIAYPLVENSERRAILGCTVENHGQLGPVFDWHGVFKTEEEVKKHLRAQNIWQLHEITKISDSTLLSVWYGSYWYSSYENRHHAAFRSKPLEERVRLVCQDLKRKKNGGRSYYRSMDTVLLAELLGVANIEDSPDKWRRFDAMYRRSLDELFDDFDMDGEDAARIVESAINEKSSSISLPELSSELVAKTPLLKKEKNRREVVNCLGEAATLELENLLNLYELQDQASNGIYGHAIWSYECPNGIDIRFQVDLSDLGEAEDIIGPYEDLMGKFSDGLDFIVSW